MSHATDQARSTRSDARAFADAFAPADDAFTFGAQAGESRTLTLAELGEVIAFDRPVALPDPRQADAPTPAPAPAADADDDELLTLDELGEALAHPPREADVLDFDFGTQAHERARLRTAARLDASASRRRASGPAPQARQSRRGDVRLVAAGPTVTRLAGADAASGARSGLADASASVAERLAEPRRSRRATPTAADLLPVGHDLPAALQPPASFLAAPGAHRPLEVVHREPSLAVSSPRGAERRPQVSVLDRLSANPDRLAMWAVLLGILLVLIAFTSGSAAVALPLLSAL